MNIGLQLLTNEKIILYRPLEYGKTTLGTNPECDICIPDQHLSPLHGIFLRDEQSIVYQNRHASGTQINQEVVLESYTLAQGDELVLGPMLVRVVFSMKSLDEPPLGSPRTKTLAVEQESTPYNVFITAPQVYPGKRFDLHLHDIHVGSDPQNDIVLSDPFVSGFHAQLRLDKGRVMVRDLDSRNGIFLDGRKIKEGEVSFGSFLRMGKSILCVETQEHSDSSQTKEEILKKRFVGNSSVAKQIRELLGRIAQSGGTVLITGETGTGKEVAARLITELGALKTKPFVALNCGALSPTLIESELFGHEKGAFTGALTRKIGAFEAAHTGTLFLDEIGELPKLLQPQLLRALESGEVRRIGSTHTFTVDVRIIAATNLKLALAVQQGAFREDLYHRLHVLSVELPALRERMKDLPPLVHHFIKNFSPPGIKISISKETIEKLSKHSWPGNVRELRNVLQRAILLRQSDVLNPCDILFHTTPIKNPQSSERKKTLGQIEKEEIVKALKQHHGSKTEASLALGISRTTLHRKMEEYDLLYMETL